MALSAILKGAQFPRISANARPPGRIAVLAWALATVAVAATLASSLFSRDAGYGASAFVTTSTVAAAPAAAAPEAQAVAVDPAAFRRPAPPLDGRPRVAVIVRGLGLSKQATAAAIADLGPDITLALSAYGRDLQRDADAARASGHEVFLDVPVEPAGFPANDAGPQAILSSLTATENGARLRWSLARFSGFPGLVFAPGSPALDDPATLAPLLAEPDLRGLIWAHAGARGFAGAQSDTVSAVIALDAGVAPAEIDAAFERLEGIARSNGAALVIVTPTPAAMARLKTWTATLGDKGLLLVPASALAVTPAS